MDPLSDLLRVIRLDGAYFYAVEASGPWRVETVAARLLSPKIMPLAEHLISYHIMTEGRCFAGLVGEEQVELAGGDVVVFPHGDAHVMSSGKDLRTGPEVADSAPDRYPNTVVLGPQGQRESSLVCGFLGCDRRPFNPLLASLPRRMHMRGVSSAWLDGFIRLVTEESRLGRAGAETVLTRLAEVMFIEVLRRYLDDLPPGQTGWLAGLRDEVVGRVLTLFHSRPGHPWTLADLAREGGLLPIQSGQRFAELVGQPPMQYLAQWRMQVAANLLAQGGGKVAAIGAEVGLRLRGGVQPRVQEGDRPRSRRLARGPPRRPLVGRFRSARRRSRKSGLLVIGEIAPFPPLVRASRGRAGTHCGRQPMASERSSAGPSAPAVASPAWSEDPAHRPGQVGLDRGRLPPHREELRARRRGVHRPARCFGRGSRCSTSPAAPATSRSRRRGPAPASPGSTSPPT